MRRGDSIVLAAQADLGRHEEGGLNRGPFIEECLNAGSIYKRKRLTGLAWCVGAVNKWTMAAHGGVLPWAWTLSCETLEATLIKRQAWFPATSTPKPGDVVLFDWDWDGDSDHAAVVQSFFTGHLITIGGNENDEVRRQERALRRVRGFGRLPSFDEEV